MRPCAIAAFTAIGQNGCSGILRSAVMGMSKEPAGCVMRRASCAPIAVAIATPAAVPHLTAYARKLWPALAGVDWTHGWGGRLAMTRDHYPHIHEPARGVLICLGYNGRGVARRPPHPCVQSTPASTGHSLRAYAVR